MPPDGSHSIDYNGVAFSIVFLGWGRTFRDFKVKSMAGVRVAIDGVYNWSLKRLLWSRGSERPAAHTSHGSFTYEDCHLTI